MPASVAPAENRTPQLLTVLFWIGVALAPLAALILLVADGNGALRFGAVLAILAVVLIGLSVALRAESGGGASGAEELREEIEQLRRELRGEIVAAAQRGNQALDQVQRTQESVTAMRRRLDAAAAGIAAAAGLATSAAEEPAGGRARVPATEPHDEGRARTEPGRAQPAARDEDEAVRRPQPGTRYGADPAADHPGHGSDRSQADGHSADRSQAGRYGGDRPQAGVYGAERPQAGAYGAERPQAGVYGAPRAPEPEVRAEPRQVGVVHHTETVHVTTRHTIVDGGGEPAGTRYGGYAGRWSPVPEERSWSGGEPDERPRAGYRSGDDDHIRPARDERSRSAQVGWSGSPGSRDDASWSGASGGEHPWAGVGRASGADRGWSAQEGEDRGWSGDRSWRSGQEGPAGDRSWPPAPGEAGWAAAPGDDAARGGQGASAGQGDRGGYGERAADGWAGTDPGRAPAEQPGRAVGDDPDGDYWSELRTGNRWAAVRDDEHGREIRVGERRAAVHADGGGTEYRVEDRWASVRGRAGSGDPGGDRAEEARPALPAGGVPVPDEWRPPTQRSGQPEWRQVEPEPARYGYPPRDDVPRAGGARPTDRWR
ncbi:hypothetical protein [Micromonospora sp. NPDC005305]|uniref:hypothetical protein n=1 Tax=Micromonospora sp. NPDC005305 TaxID=3156875 RepID=UPI0033B5F0BF